MAINSKEKGIEWACRILLTLHIYYIAGGYIAYFQTRQQLLSPLIPESTVFQITHSYHSASLICLGSFLISIWLYFFNRKIIVIIISALTILLYQTGILFLLNKIPNRRGFYLHQSHLNTRARVAPPMAGMVENFYFFSTNR